MTEEAEKFEREIEEIGKKVSGVLEREEERHTIYPVGPYMRRAQKMSVRHSGC